MVYPIRDIGERRLVLDRQESRNLAEPRGVEILLGDIGDDAMTNEVLCKIVCHNICCLIQESHGLGISLDGLSL